MAAPEPTALIGRIPIRFITPAEPEGRWNATSFVGEAVPFEATIFREGHGLLGAEVELTDPDGAVARHRMRLTGAGTDRWRADVPMTAPGRWSWIVRAWSDDWASWRRTAAVKLAAGQDVELVLAMGAELLGGRKTKLFRETAAALVDTARSPEDRFALTAAPRLVAAIETNPVRSHASSLQANRESTVREAVAGGTSVQRAIGSARVTHSPPSVSSSNL